MKKISAALGLVACTAGANASNWVLVGEGNHSNVYVDMSSIRPVASLKQGWVLYDLKKADQKMGKPVLSFKSLQAYSCNELSYITKAQVLYSGRKGAGDVVASQTFSSPVPGNVIPDSVGEDIWGAVCK